MKHLAGTALYMCAKEESGEKRSQKDIAKYLTSKEGSLDRVAKKEESRFIYISWSYHERRRLTNSSS